MGILRIMAVGKPGVGKSTIGNMLLEGNNESPFETSASSNTCTQEAKRRLSSQGDCEYTDVPGIPDTDPRKTVKFYDIIIEEANKHPTAILFVFKRGSKNPDKYKLDEMLFRELNKSDAAKILVINDYTDYTHQNPPTEADYEDQLKTISDVTKITFLRRIVLTPNTIRQKLENLKIMLSKMNNKSEHLKSFTEIKEYVDDLKKQKNNEEELLREGRERIKNLKQELEDLERKVGVDGIPGGLALLTLGAIAGLGETAVEAASAAMTAVNMKKDELEIAERSISVENLERITLKLEEACKEFDELKIALRIY